MRCLVPLLLSLLLIGCIPMPPYHVPTSRSNVPERPPDWMVPGITTLADVLLHVGEPDHSTLDERVMSWVAQDKFGGGVLIVAVGNAGGFFGMELQRERRLMVWFDDHETLDHSDVQTGMCTPGVVNFGNSTTEFSVDCLRPMPGTFQSVE